MIVLDGDTEILQAVLGSAVTTNQPSFQASYGQLATTSLEKYDSNHGTLNSTTDVALVTGVSAKQLVVKSVNVFNLDTVSITITFKKDISGTDRTIYRAVLAPNESVHYEDGKGWYTCDTSGNIKTGNAATVNIQSFTATGAGTYTPTPGMKSCIVLCTGGGGGGGGADTAGASADVAAGAGGGAGGTAIGFYSAATIGASQPLVVGAGGPGGLAANGTNGTAGTNSTFGSTLLTGTGGALGTGSGAVAVDADDNPGGLGGVPTGGTVNIPGGSGDYGYAASSATCTFGHGGAGGESFWGGALGAVARAQVSLTTDIDQAGGTGVCFGAGGGGAVSLTSSTGAAGGAGAPGIIVVIEFM